MKPPCCSADPTSRGDKIEISTKLNGKRVAILATDGVEQVELLEPRKALDEAGAKTDQQVIVDQGLITSRKRKHRAQHTSHIKHSEGAHTHLP